MLALADGGNADAMRDTRVIETWFKGRSVYVRGGDVASNSPSIE
jgi:hypothetical protein